jgi:mutator protein MutT
MIADYIHKKIGVAIVWNDSGKILIDRRLPGGSLGGYWEFPGGKVEPHETIVACIVREIAEELGITIEVGDRLIEITHDYPEFRVTLYVHHCRYLGGEVRAIECAEFHWVSTDELSNYQFPPANLAIIQALSPS